VDQITKKTGATQLEALWGQRISVYDEQDAFMTSGNTTIIVETLAADATRVGGNKVKLLALVAYAN
jgi:hypothetical protein